MYYSEKIKIEIGLNLKYHKQTLLLMSDSDSISSSGGIPSGPLEFRILTWNSHNDHQPEDADENDTEGSSGHYCIEAYGKTRNGKSVKANIIDYTPYFYIGIPVDWRTRHIDSFIEWLKRYTKYKYPGSFVSYAIVKRKKLFGFTNKTLYRFLKLTFNNTEAIRYVAGYFREKTESIPQMKTVVNKNKKPENYTETEKEAVAAEKKRVEADRAKQLKKFGNKDQYEITRNDGDTLTYKRKVRIFDISSKPFSVETYEGKTDPLTRFLYERKIKACGWLRIKDYVLNDGKCDIDLFNG